MDRNGPPDLEAARPPWTARAAGRLQQWIGGAHALSLTLLDAAVPPLLGEEGLRALLAMDYERLARYTSDAHDTVGLFPWELETLDRLLAPGRRVAVVAAGGGREVIGLLGRGMAVDAWECSARLREAGNALLARQGFASRIVGVAPDEFPPVERGRRYDLCVVGWGAYGHIFPAPRRISFLRACRNAVQAPVLISWVAHASSGPRHERLKRAVRRLVGSLPLAGKRVDDDLVLNEKLVYEALTPEKVAREAEAAGFSADVRPGTSLDAPRALLTPC
jgi:hypothetical protein